jgi:hypothetical protein
MLSASKAWWEDPLTDWSSGEPRRFVDVLVYAYDSPESVRHIAKSSGVVQTNDNAVLGLEDSWRSVLVDATQQSRLYELVAVVLHDENCNQFHPRIRELLGDRLPTVQALIVRRYGPPNPADRDSGSILESLAEGESPPLNEPVGSLQAIQSVGQGFGSLKAYLVAVTDALRRTAMIEIAGQPSGTGFLVGEDLLLTAAHVIDIHHWPPSPPREVVAIFDFDESGRSKAETGIRVAVSEFVTNSFPAKFEMTGQGFDWNAPADKLDFALLKLAVRVPPRADDTDPRGFYRLDPGTYDFAPQGRYLIPQYPFGDFIKYTILDRISETNDNGTRIRYAGNTAQGSSGSPVLDERGRLVAIHHYTSGAKNQGVPISKIAQVLLGGAYQGYFSSTEQAAPQQIPASALVRTVDPFRTHSVLGNRPLVNREKLRMAIKQMAESTTSARTLAISGESGSGVSYSYHLASHVAKNWALCPSLKAAVPDGLEAFRIDLRDYVNVEVTERRQRIAVDLLLNFRLQELSDSLAQDARHTTTLRHWIGSRLRESARQWWIFIDSIDSLVTIKQGGVDELIHALIVLADDELVPLRVVLAGREAERFADAHTDWIEREDVVGLSRADVETWLREKAREDGRTVDENRLAAELLALFPANGPLPLPRKVSPQLPKLLRDLAVVANDGS